MMKLSNGKDIEITSSWDDGGVLDMQLADLLIKYRIPATFYIPVEARDLTDNQIRQLAGTLKNCELCKVTCKLFEIGAHSITHPREFQLCSDEELRYEIIEGKKKLEDISGKKITKFCYPRGRYNDKIKQVLKEAGFEEARTVKGLHYDFPKDKLQTNPTIHVHAEHQIYGDRSWKEWAEELFDKVLIEGGRFEIWGHSWEIEKHHQWELLEDFLWYMNERMNEIKYPRVVVDKKSFLDCCKD